jgi:hypothetical protein
MNLGIVFNFFWVAVPSFGPMVKLIPLGSSNFEVVVARKKDGRR